MIYYELTVLYYDEFHDEHTVLVRRFANEQAAIRFANRHFSDDFLVVTIDEVQKPLTPTKRNIHKALW